MAAFEFNTKGQTLSWLADKINTAEILPTLTVNYGDYAKGTNLGEIRRSEDFLAAHSSLIVRSSSKAEDSLQESMAGKFLSVGNITQTASLRGAIKAVFDSYGLPPSQLTEEEVLIQPHLTNAAQVGVMFTRVPSNGSDYFVINFDDTGSCDAVTSGSSNEVNTCYIAHGAPPENPMYQKLLQLASELASILGHDALDIEFAFDDQGQLYLFQVRPLIMQNTASGVVNRSTTVNSQTLGKARTQIKEQLSQLIGPHPYLYGEKTIFGVMPDWNPAEIIGLRPKPLALSLYKELITDSIWAYQRSNYGYLNLRSFPLLTSFQGMPYVDVRVSFNSFIPRELPENIAEKLVNYYLNTLENNPTEHDKVEFNIVLSCYTLDIDNRLQHLMAAGFNESECSIIANQLRNLTNKIIDPHTGLWIQDFHKLQKLKTRQRTVKQRIDNLQQRIYWQIEDCKRYGTLPFAGLARAGFIAVQMLQSLVKEEVISQTQYHQFMHSLNTVSSEMTTDFSRLQKHNFLEKYGHLRPGTYDIESPRYDEAPDLYFNWDKPVKTLKKNSFSLSDASYDKCERLLRQHGLSHSVDSLLHFIKNAIEGREYAKFIFTRSLSDTLGDVKELGRQYGFSESELANLDISDVLRSTFATGDIKQTLCQSIARGQANYEITKLLTLPPLLSEAQQVDCFELPQTSPNYITEKKVVAPTSSADEHSDLKGKVVFITNADPGFDWLFSHSIAGLITQFGGCNSHMAIRANELEIPAVIGAGETLYNRWKQAELIEIDPVNKKVTAMR